MTTKSTISILLSTLFMACHPAAKKADRNKLKISLEIIPESDTSYSITWKDTVGQSRGYKLNTRPFEVWCILKHASDTVGYYTGMSSPANFTYFSTKDSFVTAIFMIAPNFFSDSLSDAQRKKIYEEKEKIIEFEPVKLDIKNDLRKTLEFILTEKENSAKPR